MPQYQSFPNAIGSSKSLEKLQALRLPPLAGLSFLDVGCNEGFFCGFAKHQGASRVLGLDRSAEFIDRAKARFPDLEFRCQSWDDPIDETFDVILLASALHYAEDQEALVHKLIGLLNPGGTLVLEIGMAQESGNAWVTIKRSIDERQFPTHGKIAFMLDAYAWKIIGRSVDQAGDPLSRVVVHIQHKRPYAFLLLSPSGYGKSTITRSLATAQNVTRIAGDQLISQINQGKVSCHEGIQELIRRDFDPAQFSLIIENIFQSGLGNHWVDVWLDKANDKDVIIDSYVPEGFWSTVTTRVKERGFVPVQLVWDLIGPKLFDRDTYSQLASSYLQALDGDHTNPSNTGETNLIGRVFQRKPKRPTDQLPDATLPEDFDPEEYLRLHPDVEQAGMNPSFHYLRHGITEGRRYKAKR